MNTSSRPKALPLCPEQIPHDLRKLERWVVWRYVEEIDPETGEVDWDKPPMNARGGAGSSTNPHTWSAFPVALAAYQRGKWDGIGIVLPGAKKTEEGVVLIGVDLDHCRDAATGAVEPWAQEIVATLNTYTEVSPSGAGLRLFLRGRLPPEGRKRGNFECYSWARYVTVTGQHQGGTPQTIEVREAEILAVHKRFWPEEPKQSTTTGHAQTTADLTDLELIDKAKKAKNGSRFAALWNGDVGGHASPSEADLALCSYLAFWCGPNSSERIDALFRQSGLFRSKWNRDYYRTRTIRKALDGRTEFYSPRRRPSANGAQRQNRDDKPSAPDDEGLHLTDLGNAERLTRRHGAGLRHCHPWKRWLYWDGTRWADDESGIIEAQAAGTVRTIYFEAAACEDSDKRDALFKHARKSESAHSIRAMTELARSQPGIPVLPSELDRDPWALNVANGTIGLRTGQLRPHRREDLLSKIAPVAFDPAATCPLWERCLDTWMGSNPDLVAYLRRVIGYALTADVSEQVLFFLHGAGSNGKTTFLNIIREMLGDYAIQAVSELLMVKTHEAHPTERADLFGRRFVATVETEQGKRMAESLMKQLTGGENLKARRMRENFFEVPPTWKIFLASNHHPTIRGTALAVWRRIRLIPFTVTIQDANKDKDLAAKLRAQMPGILAWAVRGCLEWQKHGLADPEEVRQATAEYQREQDTLGGFIADCCVVAPYAKVRSSVLLSAYQVWSGDKNMTRQELQKRLNDRGFQSKRGHGGHYFYHGIGLPADDPSEHE
jgi:putative DNA primase/helicase